MDAGTTGSRVPSPNALYPHYNLALIGLACTGKHIWPRHLKYKFFLWIDWPGYNKEKNFNMIFTSNKIRSYGVRISRKMPHCCVPWIASLTMPPCLKRVGRVFRERNWKQLPCIAKSACRWAGDHGEIYSVNLGCWYLKLSIYCFLLFWQRLVWYSLQNMTGNSPR